MAKEPATRAFIIAAKELYDAGRFGEAIEILQEGLKHYPSFLSARVLLGEIYWISGDAGRAKTELEQVVAAVPDNYAAHRKLATLCKELGDHETARRSCRAVLRANPKDEEMRVLLAGLPGGVEAEDTFLSLTRGGSRPARVVANQPPDPAAAPADSEREASAATSEKVAQFSGFWKSESDEIDTETLAELYLSQGHREQGIAVYRRLAALHPENLQLTTRLQALLDEDRAARETPNQAKRRQHIRRLEGWLQVIRERRRR